MKQIEFQIIEERHKEFLQKLEQLCNEYNVSLVSDDEGNYIYDTLLPVRIVSYINVYGFTGFYFTNK